MNPCGFALLPAYLGLYLGAGGTRRPGSALPRVLLVGVVVTASFVLLFGAAGIVLSAIGSALTASFPWVGLAVGVLLIVVAGRMLAGRAVCTTLGERLADRIGGPARRSDLWGYAAFGLAYGLASLGCTLPVFLVVVGGSLVVHGFPAGLVEFLFYGLGLGFVLTSLTLVVALLRQGALAAARPVVHYVAPASAILLLVTGAFVVYYWLTLGGLLPTS